jgi:pimeloyl-ACP methyl ester carboxylesterase
MERAFQLILLPGLGTDHRLFEPQRRAFPDLLVPAWIAPRGNESLPQYAARLATGLARDHRPLILGGVSFGGMLACEMVRCLSPQAIVLIASCRSPTAVQPLLAAGRPLLPLLPPRMWNVAKLLSGPVGKLVERVPNPYRETLATMFKESDCGFAHWILQAILNWRPTPVEATPVFHIHGRRDLLIPASRVKADKMIADGGHMINLTHADQVNAFLSEVATRASS